MSAMPPRADRGEGRDQDRLVQRQGGQGQPAEEKAGLDMLLGGHRRRAPFRGFRRTRAGRAAGRAGRRCPARTLRSNSAGVQKLLTWNGAKPKALACLPSAGRVFSVPARPVPPRASSADISSMHIRPSSTQRLTTRRKRSGSTSRKCIGATSSLGAASARYSLRPSVPPSPRTFADPLVEADRVGRVEAEAHLGEAGAAVVGRESVVVAGEVHHRVQLRFHAGHGVDHPGQRRHVEGVHHLRRGQPEVDRPVDRRRRVIDRGDAVLRVDEEPLPVERHHLHLDRLDPLRHRPALADPLERAERIEQMRGDPCHRAEADDDHQRRHPDHQLEAGRMVPVRIVARLARGAVAPGEKGGQPHHRDDDDEHQQRRADHQVLLLGGDVARRREHDHVAAREEREDRQGKKQRSSQDRPPIQAHRARGRNRCGAGSASGARFPLA